MPDLTPAQELSAAADKLGMMWWPRDLAHLREPLVALLRAEAVRSAVDAARVPPRRTDRELLDLARAILGTKEADHG